MTQTYLGIDVAFAKSKRLPLCFCQRTPVGLRPIPIKSPDLPKPPAGRGNRVALDPEIVREYAESVLIYLAEIQSTLGLSIQTIALDCPSTPKAENLDRREAEIQMDRLRISCFATPSETEFEQIRSKAVRHLEDGERKPGCRTPIRSGCWSGSSSSGFSVGSTDAWRSSPKRSSDGWA